VTGLIESSLLVESTDAVVPVLFTHVVPVEIRGKVCGVVLRIGRSVMPGSCASVVVVGVEPEPLIYHSCSPITPTGV
jgi:hypothetical protein